MKNLLNLQCRQIIPTEKIPVWMIIILGLITAIGPLATDMYLPAFPQVNQDLIGYGNGAAQMTLAAWFVGLAIGQFSMGPISDRFGRRTPLLLGILLFTLASIGCAIFSNFYLFCLFRLLGAVGGSAGMVISRAMVRDISSGSAGIKIMAQLALVSCIVPIVAPTLGSFVVAKFDWRWLFWIMTLYGFIGTAAIAFCLPDTLSFRYRIQSSFTSVLWRYFRIMREPIFLSNTMITGFGTFIIFAYLSGTPIVLGKIMHFSALQLGIWFGVNSVSIAACNQINSLLINKFKPNYMIHSAVILACITGTIFIISSLFPKEVSWFSIIVSCTPIVIIMGSLGFIFPNCTIFAFTLHGRHAGSASALLGTIQFILGSISSSIMSFMPENSMVPIALIIFIGVLGMGICDIWRHKSTTVIITKMMKRIQQGHVNFNRLLKDLN